jgi:hypothetical protein
LIEGIKNSSNLIGGEQKFVSLAFTLEANGQQTMASKTSTCQQFLGVLAPRISQVEENLSAIFMQTQTLFKQTNFSFQTYTKYTICIF